MVAPLIDRPTWLRLRREPLILLGSSSAAAACGESEYESTLHLHLRMRGLIPEEDLSGNESVYFGNALEHVVAREYARRLERTVLDSTTEVGRERIEALLTSDGGCRVIGWVYDEDEPTRAPQAFVVSTARPWQSATLDAPALDGAGELEIGELKTQGERRVVEWGVDQPAPQDYYLQGMHQLAVVTAARRCVLVALIGGNKIRHCVIERVPHELDALNTLESAFMAALERGEEPAADGSESTKRALKQLHPDDNGLTIVLPSECIVIHERLREIEAISKPTRAELKSLDDEAGALEARLEQLIGSNTFGELPDGSGRYSLKTTGRRVALKVDELPEQFVRTTTYRTLRFAAPKAARSRS